MTKEQIAACQVAATLIHAGATLQATLPPGYYKEGETDKYGDTAISGNAFTLTNALIYMPFEHEKRNDYTPEQIIGVATDVLREIIEAVSDYPYEPPTANEV